MNIIIVLFKNEKITILMKYPKYTAKLRSQMKNPKNRCQMALIITLLLISSVIAKAAGTENKVVFLQFHIDSNSISLTKSTMADGELKKTRIRTESKEIYFEIVSKDSQLLSSGNIENPLVRKFEYENPDKPGEILQKIVNLESAEFTVRINYNNQIDKINFYRTHFEKDIKSVRNSENLIGSVSLRSISGGENE
jgi:hypothetical protein